MVAKRMHCGSEQLVAGTSIHSLTHERENELVIKRMSATECASTASSAEHANEQVSEQISTAEP